MAKNFINNINKKDAEVREVITRRRVGRPKEKNGNYKKITFEIEENLLDQVNIAKASYLHNLTKYINSVIEKDIKENFEKYLKEYERQENL